MSTNTTTASTTNASRATDAKLHEWLGLLQRGDYNLEVVHAIELALAPELREDYATELVNEIVDREDLRGIASYPARDRYEEALAYRGIYALITATAAQRALALVAVLERVRGEVGT